MEIQERTLKYSIRTLKFIRKINKSVGLDIIFNQLLRSATSIGANLSEADSASSRKDFVNKVFISKKEAQETEYWLEVIKGSDIINNLGNQKELNELIAECREIILILAAIIRKTKA